MHKDLIFKLNFGSRIKSNHPCPKSYDEWVEVNVSWNGIDKLETSLM